MSIRVDVAALKIGMYVIELDRPWLESPFLFQGFLIQTDDELKTLQELCQFVLVDMEQSLASLRTQLKQTQLDAEGRSTTNFGIKKTERDEAHRFHESLHIAHKNHQQGRRLILTALSQAKHGKLIKVRDAQELVEEMAQNIMVNHNTMLWLTYLKSRDEYTLNHCINVSILAMNFARHLKLERGLMERLGLGALLHDLGKARIPGAILNKPGRLTPEEFTVMKTHPSEGYALLKGEEGLPHEVLDIVLHHHERLNSRGYPDALTADHVGLLTRIASIVDVYDAITSDRCYHDGISPYTALQNIYNWINDGFDKNLVEEFISCMGLYPVGCVVELNTKQIGVVIASTPNTRLRPMVLLLFDQNRQPLATRTIINLSTQTWQKGTQRIEIQKVIEAKTLGLDVKTLIEQEALLGTK